MKPAEWEELLLAATDRVREEISPIWSSGQRNRTVGIGASGDMTILADKAAEDVIIEALNQAGKPRVLSEEAGMTGDPESKTLAVVDPLDGSSNFGKGIPFFCTAVAIAEGDRMEDLLVGVIRDLVTGDAYSAIRGRGAKKNGKRILTSLTKNLSDAVVGIDVGRGKKETTERIATLANGAKRVVHFGANALELCYLADGRTDAFVDLRGRLRITDLAAAYLIASEAGAVVSQADGAQVRPRYDLAERFSFVASANADLHKQILELLRWPEGRRMEKS